MFRTRLSFSNFETVNAPFGEVGPDFDGRTPGPHFDAVDALDPVRDALGDIAAPETRSLSLRKRLSVRSRRAGTAPPLADMNLLLVRGFDGTRRNLKAVRGEH